MRRASGPAERGLGRGRPGGILRATHRRCSARGKARSRPRARVAEDGVAEPCRRDGIAASMSHAWSDECPAPHGRGAVPRLRIPRVPVAEGTGSDRRIVPCGDRGGPGGPRRREAEREPVRGAVFPANAPEEPRQTDPLQLAVIRLEGGPAPPRSSTTSLALVGLVADDGPPRPGGSAPPCGRATARRHSSSPRQIPGATGSRSSAARACSTGNRSSIVAGDRAACLKGRGTTRIGAAPGRHGSEVHGGGAGSSAGPGRSGTLAWRTIHGTVSRSSSPRPRSTTCPAPSSSAPVTPASARAVATSPPPTSAAAASRLPPPCPDRAEDAERPTHHARHPPKRTRPSTPEPPRPSRCTRRRTSWCRRPASPAGRGSSASGRDRPRRGSRGPARPRARGPIAPARHQHPPSRPQGPTWRPHRRPTPSHRPDGRVE